MAINHRLIEIKTKIEQNPPNGRIKAFQFEFLIWWNSSYQPIEITIVSTLLPAYARLALQSATDPEHKVD